MSSIRRIIASRSNGARSKGPVTPEGKRRSSQNAIAHGLLAAQIVLPGESPEGFQSVLNDHLERLAPADGVEYGLIEEMAASYWRLRRAWSIETRMIEKETAGQASGSTLDRMAAAFSDLAGKPELPLIHRYQTRLHLNYQRALQNMLLLRLAAAPNEPSPISEHSPSLEPGHPLLIEASPAPDGEPDDNQHNKVPFLDGL